MAEHRVYMKDLIWRSFAGPIPAGFKVAQKHGEPLDNRRQNLHRVPADQYPGEDDQVYAVVGPGRPRRARRSR